MSFTALTPSITSQTLLRSPVCCSSVKVIDLVFSAKGEITVETLYQHYYTFCHAVQKLPLEKQNPQQRSLQCKGRHAPVKICWLAMTSNASCTSPHADTRAACENVKDALISLVNQAPVQRALISSQQCNLTTSKSRWAK